MSAGLYDLCGASIVIENLANCLGKKGIDVTIFFHLRKNVDIAQLMGENGRKYVETEASIEVIGLKMKKILEKLTQKVLGN